MAVPAYIDGQTQDSAGATTITFDMSTITHTTDDLMIAFVKQSENTAQQIWDDDGGGGEGWTRAAYNRTTGGRDQETAIFWKFATSASENDPTFDWDSGGTNEPMSGSLIVYRGVDTVIPFQGPTYLAAQNDANPPNPDVDVNFANTRVVCFHAATHDDISTVAAPTGFTLRTQVWNGTSDDHRNHFTADIERDTIESYSPPDWQHSVLNTTPEYHTYTMALNEAQNIHLTSVSGGPKYQWSDTNLTASGDGFEATQSTGKIELWSDKSGTTKVSQSVDSWSDTSIQFDLTQGSLVDGTNYLVVTNDSGDVSLLLAMNIGFGPYDPVVGTDADLYWAMNNSYADTGARNDGKDFDNVQTGTPDFVATPITRTNTHSFRINQAVESSEVADSAYTNITNTHGARDIGGWIRLEDDVTLPATFYEEGGGVNNLYLLMTVGNNLVANVADSSGSPDFKAQAYSDFPLVTGRPYHVLLHFEAGDEIALYIDGVKQAVTGDVGTDTTMSVHSGDWSFGDSDSNLDTGGVDIAYAAINTILYAHWGTWSDTGGGAPLTLAQIRDELFKDGALPDTVISTGTQAAMQASIDDDDDSTLANWPLVYEIEAPTGGGDLELTITNQIFPDEATMHVRWLGTGTLTIRNSGTSNMVDSVATTHFPNSGDLTIIETAQVALTVKDINTKSAVENARVLLYADTGGPLPADETVTIARSGSVATVTHTAHGMTRSNQSVRISGAVQPEYNGLHDITIVDANSYTYTVSGTPTTPATGTIKCDAIIIHELTTAAGIADAEIDFTSNQPVTGHVAQGTSSTYYKRQPITGTITAAGLTATVLVIPDE